MHHCKAHFEGSMYISAPKSAGSSLNTSPIKRAFSPRLLWRGSLSMKLLAPMEFVMRCCTRRFFPQNLKLSHPRSHWAASQDQAKHAPSRHAVCTPGTFYWWPDRDCLLPPLCASFTDRYCILFTYIHLQSYRCVILLTMHVAHKDCEEYIASLHVNLC